MNREQKRAFIREEKRATKKVRALMVAGGVKYITTQGGKKTFFKHMTTGKKKQAGGNRATADLSTLRGFLREVS